MCNHHGKRKSPRRGVSRRDVIRYGIASTLGIAALGPLGKGILQSASGDPIPNYKRCIVIYCYGGYDGLQMVVPHGLGEYYTERPGIGIPAASTLSINKVGYGLNPGLPTVASCYADGDVAIFQKVGYPDDDLSHFESQNFYSWGVRNGFGPLGIDESGWVARFADLYTNDSLGAISVGVASRHLTRLPNSKRRFSLDSL